MKLLVLCICLVTVDSSSQNNDKVKGLNSQKDIRETYEQGQKNVDHYGDLKARYGYGDTINIEDNKGKDNGEAYDTVKESEEYTLSYVNRNSYIDNSNTNPIGYEYKCDSECSNKGNDDQKNVMDNNDSNKKYVIKEAYVSSYNHPDGYDKDQYINLVGLGNNDVEDIVRPCALDDWQCIRKYFAKNSKCKPTFGPVPDPLYFKRNVVYFPNVNVTNVRTRLRVSGLSNFKISEFYVNKDTGNLVLALNFQNLTQYTPKTYVRYKRTARDSIVLSDFAAVVFKSGSFTAVIPKIPHLRLDYAEVHANIDDAVPNLIFGPGAFNSTDPDVIAAFTELTATLPILSREEFLLTSQLYITIYIQEYLCDFGLKLYSI